MATLTTSYQLIASKYIGAVSGSGVATKSVYLRVYAKHGTQDIVNNKTPVTYKSVLYVEGSGTYFYTGTPTTKSLSGTGASATSGSAVGNYYLGETTLSEISGTVSHNSSGAASISVTAGWNSTPWGINGSVTGTATLPTIPRVTKPTFSKTSCTMNGSDSITITMNPASGTFKHKIRYAFGSLTQKAEGVAPMVDGFTTQGNSTATFTPPASLCSQIKSSMSGTCTITCYTYTAEGKLIGSYDQKVTLNVPDYTPTIDSITLTGNALLNGDYVQGKSTVTAMINGHSHYADIISVSSEVDGKKYPGAVFTSNVMSSGDKVVKVTIIDTRGKVGTSTSSAFKVYAYSNPIITEFTLVRDSATPTTVIATVKGNIAAINNKNGKVIQVTLNGVTNTITSSSYAINGTTTFTNVPTDSSFSGNAYLADYYTSTTKTVVLPTVDVTMDFHHSGKGVAFGKVAEDENLLDVAWNIRTSEYSKVTGYKYLGAVDLNEIKTPGMYGVYNATNSPINTISTTSTISTLEVVMYSPDWIVQRLIHVESGTIYIRNWCWGTTWGSWRTLLTAELIAEAALDDSKVNDYIVEQGINNGWNYRKWNSGHIELNKWVGTNTTISTAYGNGYYNGSTLSVDVPFLIANQNPVINITAQATNAQICSAAVAAYNSSVNKLSYYITSPSNRPASDIYVHFIVLGKWK